MRQSKLSAGILRQSITSSLTMDQENKFKIDALNNSTLEKTHDKLHSIGSGALDPGSFL